MRDAEGNLVSRIELVEGLNRMIESQPLHKRREFFKFMYDSSGSRDWCRENGINYLSPDFVKVKEIAYEQFEWNGNENGKYE